MTLLVGEVRAMKLLFLPESGNGETSKGGVAAAKETSSAKGHSNSSSDRGRDSKSSDREDMVRDRIGYILGF
jgi:hypothetical protein